MLDIFINSITTGLFPEVYKILVVVLPLVLPIILFCAFWIIRLRYIQMRFIEKQKKCLLEIKLPKEITKSPAAMEIFFSYMTQSGAGGYAEAYLDGKTRPWFSCELVSKNGEVHFYVWCSQAKFKTIIESQLYAQYPNVEVYEVKDDYVKDFTFDLKKYFMFAVQYTLTKSDPFPIKTYIDYGLDKDQKDEYKIDPMTAVLEFLGSLSAGENAWIQILIRKHEPESWKHGTFKMDTDPKKANFFQKFLISIFGKSKKLKDEIADEIKKIRESTLQDTGSADLKTKFPNPTKGQNEIIAALERSATKPAFDCMIRSIYITESASTNPVNIGGLIGSMRQYSSNNLNGFRPAKTTDVSDTYKDFARILPFLNKYINKEVRKLKKDMFHAYKLRSFFEYPYKNYECKPFILTTEELATIFHFPSSMVSQTPTLKRVASKKSEAPSNLPI
jgi:hypothetical protein